MSHLYSAITKIHDVKTIDELDICFKEICNYYTIENFSIISIPKNKTIKNKFFMFGSYPNNWIEKYKQENYYMIDPVLQKSDSLGAPFYWDFKVVDHLPFEEKTMFENAYDHDVKTGTTIPFLPEPNIRGYLTILNTNNVREEVFYSLAYVSTFYLNFIKRANIEKYLEKLTARESEILLLKSNGYCTKQVSQILGISDATAIFHLKNIREKLGTNSTEQSLYRLGCAIGDID